MSFSLLLRWLIPTNTYKWEWCCTNVAEDRISDEKQCLMMPKGILLFSVFVHQCGGSPHYCTQFKLPSCICFAFTWYYMWCCAILRIRLRNELDKSKQGSRHKHSRIAAVAAKGKDKVRRNLTMVSGHRSRWWTPLYEVYPVHRPHRKHCIYFYFIILYTSDQRPGQKH